MYRTNKPLVNRAREYGAKKRPRTLNGQPPNSRAAWIPLPDLRIYRQVLSEFSEKFSGESPVSLEVSSEGRSSFGASREDAIADLGSEDILLVRIVGSHGSVIKFLRRLTELKPGRKCT